jgi:hypothetical protein
MAILVAVEHTARNMASGKPLSITVAAEPTFPPNLDLLLLSE